MSADPGIDVLVVSVLGTPGWRHAARELTAALDRAGARVAAVEAPAPRAAPTFLLTDLLRASAARKAALIATAEHRPEAIVYCSITAALLWSRPGAIWLDATAAETRPGAGGLWQRRLERRRLARAPLVLTRSEPARDGLRDRLPGEAVTMPVPVAPSGPIDGPRDIAVLLDAGDPAVHRRLDGLLEAWPTACHDDETLVVAGVQRPDRPGVRFTGRLASEQLRGLGRRARVVVVGAGRADDGVAAREALADGAMLVAGPGSGPISALARELDPRLVGEDLVGALRAGLDDPHPDYAARAARRLAPFSREAVMTTISKRVLPDLLPGWRG